MAQRRFGEVMKPVKLLAVVLAGDGDDFIYAWRWTKFCKYVDGLSLKLEVLTLVWG